MSFGLGRGRKLIDEGIAGPELPALPDDLLTNRSGGHLDLGSWFQKPDRPLELEIGFGKAAFLLQQAPRQPETNFIGLEYAYEFYLYGADRLRRAAVANVKVLCTDAGEFMHWRVPDASLAVIHLYFADPWPKSKHNRRRMVQDRFLLDCHRTLIPGGELRIVTDHDDYWAWIDEHLNRFTGGEPGTLGEAGPSRNLFSRHLFTPVIPAKGADDDQAAIAEGVDTPAVELVGSNFERKYKVEGRDFHAAVLRKPVG